MEKVIIIGAGQHCNVILYNIIAQDLYTPACIAEVNHKLAGSFVGKVLIEPFDNFSKEAIEKLEQKYETNNFIIGFGTMKYRRKVFQFLYENGWNPINVIHPNAVVSSSAVIGKGVLIEAGCLVTPSPVIGNNVVINTGSQVNHDNIVHDHVYIASGVILSGGVEIGENTLLDDGVIVTLGQKIGANCIIGAGAVVTKNIEDNKVAFGAPCKPVRDNTI